ncbi:hypothetical protein SXCC_03364 [Gluconacetobacter sp. SXCC-1]|nr:hypothetical protein SXCC_03364 [Gluconacetobacter sp. SXCC-1]
MKLFSKSFEECSLFEKRWHPETFIVVGQVFSPQARAQ